MRLCFCDPEIFFLTTDMTDFKEQKICIKFCFNLKKPLQKPTECYRKASKIMPWAKAKWWNFATSCSAELLNSSFQAGHFDEAYNSALRAISFVFINSFSRKMFLTRKANVKNWQCCLKRRSKEANVFHLVSFTFSWGSTVDYGGTFRISTY